MSWYASAVIPTFFSMTLKRSNDMIVVNDPESTNASTGQPQTGVKQIQLFD